MNPITHDPAVVAAPIIAAGVLLRKEDDFFTTHNGDGMAILTSAPAGAYASLAKRFAALRQTLSVH